VIAFKEAEAELRLKLDNLLTEGGLGEMETFWRPLKSSDIPRGQSLPATVEFSGSAMTILQVGILGRAASQSTTSRSHVERNHCKPRYPPWF